MKRRKSSPDAPDENAGPAERIRVLVADDHSVVREGLVSLIRRQKDMAVTGEVSNGADAVACWRRERPDVTLLDLRMPELDGVGALQAIRAEFPGARVVVLTTFDGDEDIYRAIKAGARAYLLKDVGREALMDCIRRVHRGETCIAAEVMAKLAQRVSGEELTRRELEVLQLIAQGHSNKEIGAKLFISETTVKSHAKAIFGKLNVISRTEAVTTASRRGLIQI